MGQALVDTNVLIDFSKNKVGLLGKYIKGKWELSVNPVIVAEFLNDRWLNSRSRQEKAENFIFLNFFCNICV